MREEQMGKGVNFYRNIDDPRVDFAACNFTPESRKLWQQGSRYKTINGMAVGRIAPTYFLRGLISSKNKHLELGGLSLSWHHSRPVRLVPL